MSATKLAPTFFIAVVTILLVCRVVGWLLKRLDQPPVVGEMVAGVLLGPSLLGLLAPAAERTLFPPELRPTLYVAGQIGLVLFMFHSGYELKINRVRTLAASSGVIAGSGIAVPATLGIAWTFGTRNWFHVGVPGVSTTVTSLFVGVALAITAFPMMARIIVERGLAGSHFGSVALTAGAIDDVVAWVLLSVVLSLASGGFRPAILATGGMVVFVVSLLLIRRLLSKMFASTMSSESTLLLSLVVLLLCAWYADNIGLYSVFGAFALGIAFPRSPRADRVLEAITPLGKTMFLPLFFAYSGLNTNFGLLNSPSVLLFTLGCLAVAILGKLGACTGAARLMKEPSAVAIRVGVLMNARGLMQLIALNVGLSAGIVAPQLFTVLVLVALVTTMMASPILGWLDRRDRRRGVDPDRLLADEPATLQPAHAG